ncbi:MAG: polysaccharide biosynthesis/export family protein, partial [Bdellovibrionales bacterium]
LMFLLVLPDFAQAQSGTMPRVPKSSADRVAPPGDYPGQQPMEAAPMPQPMPVPAAQIPPNAGVSASPAAINDYVLGVGDKLEITVFGEEDLSGIFQVSSTGTISMPLIGEVSVAGRTAGDVQRDIAGKLEQGYMKNPHVSMQVSSYRPFFIVGEVMKPGSYTYVNGMTVINAVALAGGYTYRADKDDIKIKHGGVNGTESDATETSAVMPGDVITIHERFF